ncbi:MAG: UDP-3-O-(3-hydroxymyristoyl)glucosamine N-acyltransferase [Pseudomonadota bacterium]
MPTIGAIAERLGFEAVGDAALPVTGAAHPAEARPDQIALALDKKHLAFLEGSRARCAMIPPDAPWRDYGLAAAILAPRARYALSGVTTLFARPFDLDAGIHPSAVIAPTAEIGADVWIGPFATIGAGARIEAGARIASHCAIGSDVELGAGALLHPGVRLLAGVRIGRNVIIQSNAVIGGDGFSFVTPEKGAVESAKESGGVQVGAENRVFARIHSLGAVTIGDDVEIGANTAIDRGTVVDTRVGHGAKIDNLVQIGHNVQIGENCLLCGQVGLAGSVALGDRVVLGGKVGVADHVKIGHDSVIMANAAVASNIKPRSVMGGAPAVPREEFTRVYMATRRLPRMLDEVQNLKKRLSDEGRGE